MKEPEWNTCTDPEKLVLYLMVLGTLSERKFRLFSTACVRRVWHLLGQEGRNAIEVTELFVDGRATEAQRVASVTAAEKAAGDVAMKLFMGRARTMIDGNPGSHVSAANAAWMASGYGAVNPLAVFREAAAAASKGERRTQLAILRDIFGPLPFRSVHVDPAWRNPTVVGMAATIYEERSVPEGHFDNARLAVLADALEEAGCTDAEVLGHLRQDDGHVRGCWCLDLIIDRK